MGNSILIPHITHSMREYQKKNNITRQCVTNAQSLCDIIKNNSTSNAKTKAVFVVAENNEEDANIIVSGHLVVELDDETILEPSYDIFCLQNKSYLDNIKDVVNIFDNKVTLKTKIDIKNLICDHIHCIILA